MHIFGKVLTATVVFLPSLGYSIGLSDIKLYSALNQPFDAEVQVLDLKGIPLKDIGARLATPDEFAQIGIERTGYLTNFDFEITRNDSGKAVVKITTDEPMDDPIITFVMEVMAPSGKLLRQYTLFLDPVNYERPKIVALAQAEQSINQKAKLPVPSLLKPQASLPNYQPNVAIVKPKQVTIRVEEERPMPPAVKTQPKVIPVPVAPKANISESVEYYGPVSRNDTLWHIASDYSGNGVSTKQVMVAIFQANPQAFAFENTNSLKTGYTLKIPNRAGIKAISYPEANRILKEQRQQWLQLHTTQVTKKANKISQVTLPRVPEKPTMLNENQEQPSLENSEKEDEVLAPSISEQDVVNTPSIEKPKMIQFDKAPVSAVEAEPEERLLDDNGDSTVATLRAELAVVTEQLSALEDDNETITNRVAELENENQGLKQELDSRQQAIFMLEKLLAQQQPPQSIPKPSQVEEAKALTSLPGDTQMIAKKTGSQGGTLPDNEFPWIMIFSLLSLLGAVIGGGYFYRRYRRNESMIDADDLHFEPLSDSVEENEEPDEDEFHDLIEDEDEIPQDDSIEICEEADVFLAYGRYEKAKDILSSALSEDPSQGTLVVKLLETYALMKDKKSFQKLHKTLPRDFKRLEPVLYGKVKKLKQTKWEESLSSVDSSAESEAGIPELKTKPSTTPKEAPEAKENLVEFEHFEFHDDEFNVSTSMSDDNLIEQGIDASGEEDASTNENSYGTMLDLARAYIDMGDTEEAKNLLSNIIDSDDEQLKADAQALLAKINSQK